MVHDGVAQYRAGLDQQTLASLTETVRLNQPNAPALLYLGNLESSARELRKRRLTILKKR